MTQIKAPNFTKIGKRSSKPRTPLRTTAEMAEEFGVPVTTLRAYIASKGAPEGKFGFKRCVYHDPIELRKWWKGIKR